MLFYCGGLDITHCYGTALAFLKLPGLNPFQCIVKCLLSVVGDQIDMECNVHGVPYPTITWSKNGVPIDAQSQEYRMLMKSKILRIQNAEVLFTAV